jgi:hypothetical protein
MPNTVCTCCAAAPYEYRVSGDGDHWAELCRGCATADDSWCVLCVSSPNLVYPPVAV